ncbi:hypothetical protein NAC44_03490 [Allorhizobium sp. BGMRC 0089]|uniref:hypothetical protein n=1 Tax=Allorhizobium sonneratiae TaxID=2934936 RepID=UPI0020339169|nr:hypothetical protein [Allorhizobium sonneratiae]MCM2291391.1 hypothetical protein [Allorhizobium sonneratiae]
MIKIIIAGVWAVIVALVAVYFSVSIATAPVAHEDPNASKIATQVVRGEQITIPDLEKGGVQGYFLSRLSFVVDKDKVEKVEIPMNTVMTDELFSLLVGNKMIDMSNGHKLDVNAFREKIKDDVNKRLGAPVVTEVLIEQLDYLSKQEIDQGGTPKLKPAVKLVEGDKLPPDAQTGK